MATTFYANDTASSLSISGKTVRSLTTTRDDGIITKTQTSVTSTTPVYDTGTTPLVFAIRVDSVTISGTVEMNIWANESNMSANNGFNGHASVYTNAGALRFELCPETEFDDSSEYAFSGSAVRNDTGTPTTRALDTGDWIVFEPQHGVRGTGSTSYTDTFSYGGTTGAADGDTYITFTETIYPYGTTPQPAAGFPIIGGGYYPR